MKVLQSTYFCLNFLGICSDVCQPRVNDFLRNFNGIITLAAHLGPMILLYAMFTYSNFPNLNAITLGSIMILGGTSGTINFLSLGIQMKSLKKFCAEIQTIVDHSKHVPAAFKIYEIAERKCQLYAKLTFNGVCTYVFMMFIMYVILATKNMHRGNWDVTTYTLPHKTTIPFIDNRTMHGFIIRLMIQIYGGQYFCLTLGVITIYFVNCCVFIDAFCQEIKLRFDGINELLASDDRKKNLIEIKKQLKATVVLHIKTMECVNRFE